MKICAIIVAYNRLVLLQHCIQALRKQTRPLDGIMIIDNDSSDGTSEWLKTQSGMHVLCQTNAGSAGGFANGMQWAEQLGYDWVWLMDDDCEPEGDALELLCHQISLPGVLALASAVVNPGHGININHALRSMCGRRLFPAFGIPVPHEEYQHAIIDLNAATYTGLLVAMEAIRALGVPRRELFIHYDDTEYTLRLRRSGRIVLVPDAVVNHSSAAATDYYDSMRRAKYPALWITYFGNRNRIWLARHCGAAGIWFWIEIIRGGLRKTLNVIQYDRDHRMKRILIEWLAIFNGTRGNFDNDFPRRYLYGSGDDFHRP